MSSTDVDTYNRRDLVNAPFLGPSTCQDYPTDSTIKRPYSIMGPLSNPSIHSVVESSIFTIVRINLSVGERLMNGTQDKRHRRDIARSSFIHQDDYNVPYSFLAQRDIQAARHIVLGQRRTTYAGKHSGFRRFLLPCSLVCSRPEMI